MYLHCVQKKAMLNQSRRPIKLLTRLSIGLNVSEVRRSIGLNIVLAHRYELCFCHCQVLGSQVSVILATYVTAVLRH